jgi:predicted RNA methylase
MYDGQDLLDAFKLTGVFPKIHQAIFKTVAERVVYGGVVDLCCSTGLLGEQIRSKLSAHVVGIEADTEAILRGVAAGVKIPIMSAKIDPPKLDVIAEWLRAQGIKTVIARRCFPELFGGRKDFGHAFVAKIAEIGIGEIVLQGRVVTRNATNELSSLAKEIQLCESHYEVIALSGPCAYLRRRR